MSSLGVIYVLTGTLLVTIFISILLIIYIILKQKERRLLIEKGVDISGFDSKKYRHFTNLRTGILLISLAIGLIFGYITTTFSNIAPFIAYTVSLLLCEGIGFVIYYLLHKNLYR